MRPIAPPICAPARRTPRSAAAAGQYSGQVATPLFTDRYAPVCSPRLDIRRPKHLAGTVLIHREWGPHASGPRLPSWRRWAEERGAKSVDPEAGVVAADEESAIRAAVAGQGVALASLTLVAAELDAGALVQPLRPRARRVAI